MDQVTSRLDQIRTHVGGGTNIIFLLMLHFLFSAWTEMAQWHGSNLTFTNTFLILTLAWTLHAKVSTTPVFCGLMIECLGVLNDIIVISLFYPSSALRYHTATFSAVMAIFNLIIRFWGILLLHGEYVRRGALATGEATVPDASGASGFVVVDKGHDIASVTSGVYNVAAPPQNGGHVLPPRPGSAASSHLSGYGYSQTPYQGPHVKTDPLPDIPPSYKQHT